MEKSLNYDLIEERKAELGLSQSSIAASLGLSRNAVSKWFKGQSFPRPAELLKLGRLLGLSHSELVADALAVEEPLVAFRKRGAGKTTEQHLSRARTMGHLLRPLVEYLDFDPFLGPPSLKAPSADYRYVQDLVSRIRREIGVGEGAPIRFEELIGLFRKHQAVLIPALWGEKTKHENALHIHLPDSKTTWIYLNLDVKIHDFKFWMAHELGHAMTIDLLEEGKLKEAEDFSDAFAGALLFPIAAADEALESYSKRRAESGRLEALCDFAQRYQISPFSVYKETEKAARQQGAAFIDIPQSELHKRIARFNNEYPLLSQALFDDNTPSADRFMRIAEERFGTSIYKALGSYIKEKRPSASFVSNLLSVSPMDAHAYCEALSQ